MAYKKVEKLDDKLVIYSPKEAQSPYILSYTGKIYLTNDDVSYGHEFDYDELSKEFTIENIKENWKNWSIPIENKFIGMRRTPDINYHYYMVITKWDELYMHKNVPLTYELARYLQSIDITIGGTYCESDGGYLEEDHRNQVYNGLKFFTNHHIETEEDIIKIVNDVTLLEPFLT